MLIMIAVIDDDADGRTRRSQEEHKTREKRKGLKMTGIAVKEKAITGVKLLFLLSTLLLFFFFLYVFGWSFIGITKGFSRCQVNDEGCHYHKSLSRETHSTKREAHLKHSDDEDDNSCFAADVLSFNWFVRRIVEKNEEYKESHCSFLYILNVSQSLLLAWQSIEYHMKPLMKVMMHG